jgi:hypothetical protein
MMGQSLVPCPNCGGFLGSCKWCNDTGLVYEADLEARAKNMIRIDAKILEIKAMFPHMTGVIEVSRQHEPNNSIR